MFGNKAPKRNFLKKITFYCQLSFRYTPIISFPRKVSFAAPTLWSQPSEQRFDMRRFGAREAVPYLGCSICPVMEFHPLSFQIFLKGFLEQRTYAWDSTDVGMQPKGPGRKFGPEGPEEGKRKGREEGKGVYKNNFKNLPPKFKTIAKEQTHPQSEVWKNHRGGKK